MPRTMLDWCSEAQSLADDMCNATHPGQPHRDTPRGWSNVPRWLRWLVLADGLVLLAAVLVAVIH